LRESLKHWILSIKTHKKGHKVNLRSLYFGCAVLDSSNSRSLHFHIALAVREEFIEWRKENFCSLLTEALSIRHQPSCQNF